MEINTKVFFSFHKEASSSEEPDFTGHLLQIADESIGLISEIKQNHFESDLNTMKTLFTLLTILICSILVTGCSKNQDAPETAEARVARLLTGEGNRYWHLSEIYINGTKQVLTDAQLKYTKTFTASAANADPAATKKGTFTDQDGYTGTWVLGNSAQLFLTITNNPAGPAILPYLINSITITSLDIQYTDNNTLKTEREVYYGY